MSEVAEFKPAPVKDTELKSEKQLTAEQKLAGRVAQGQKELDKEKDIKGEEFRGDGVNLGATEEQQQGPSIFNPEQAVQNEKAADFLEQDAQSQQQILKGYAGQLEAYAGHLQQTPDASGNRDSLLALLKNQRSLDDLNEMHNAIITLVTGTEPVTPVINENSLSKAVAEVVSALLKSNVSNEQVAELKAIAINKAEEAKKTDEEQKAQDQRSQEKFAKAQAQTWVDSIFSFLEAIPGIGAFFSWVRNFFSGEEGPPPDGGEPNVTEEQVNKKVS